MNFFYKIISIIRAALSPSQLNLLRPADILLIDSVFNRSYTLDGKAYSPILDSIKELLENKNFTTIRITSPLSPVNKEKSEIEAILVDREYARCLLKDKLFFHSRKTRYLLWINILKKVSPRYVIGIQPAYDLCAAGKELGIKVCDFQHGIIEPEVYYSVKFTDGYYKNGLPDICFCWDEPSASALRRLLPSVNALTVGNPWIHRFKENRSSDSLVCAERDRLSKVIGSNRKILITLQWNRGEIDKIPITPLMLGAIDKLVRDGWSCWVRFHPVQIRILGLGKLRNEWVKLTGYDFDSEKMIDVSEYALPNLFSAVSIHATAYSASAIDASLMGVSTILWDKNEKTQLWFLEYIKAGSVHFAPTMLEDLIQLINTLARENSDDRLPNPHSVEDLLQSFLRL